MEFMKQRLIIGLVDALTSATIANKISWTAMPGDCYGASISNRILHLHWLYWYNKEGTTLDRQGVIITIQEQDLTLVWGTAGIRAVERLLDAIDDKWRTYHQRIRNACVKIVAVLGGNMDDNLAGSPFHDDCARLLSVILKATESGEIVWRRKTEDGNEYYASTKRHPIEIRFLQPVDCEERTVGKLVARLSIPNVDLSFVSGSEGYFMIEEILSRSISEFRDRILREQAMIRVEIDILNRALKVKPPRNSDG